MARRARRLLISWCGEGEPVALAASELARYLGRLVSSCEPVLRGPRSTAPRLADLAESLWLGTFADFNELDGSWPVVAEPTIDDAIVIDVQAGHGLIAGSNPRSVLIAAYRWLTELGCHWVRPGVDGEYLPPLDLTRPVRLAEAAAYRHRGICIEGAVGVEHVAAMIEWAPKVGLNSYFIQFRTPMAFFERWSSHRANPLLPAQPLTVEQAQAATVRLVSAIDQRGLRLHAVGHGWTSEPLGLPSLDWAPINEPVPAAVVPYLAEINGQRGLWHDIPLSTQLCYASAAVCRLIVEAVIDYARRHPTVAVLHLWLADGENNHCECPACRQARPADWYIQLLNEVDAGLTAAGLTTRIAFLLYVDLLWPPEHERLRHPERFLLIFAPISRSYRQPFPTTAPTSAPPLPPYERNRLHFPRSAAENLAFLRAWRQRFAGEAVDFDYHLMWDHHGDPGQIATATVLHTDIRRLASLGLSGLISCQSQRCAFPTGLPLWTLARSLWQPEQPFERLADEYLRAAFGPDGPAVLAYCQALSQHSDATDLRGERAVVDAAVAERLARLPAVIAAFRPVIARNRAAIAEPCWARSWHYLAEHAELTLQLVTALHHRASGQPAAASQRWQQLRRTVQEREADLHPVLDVEVFCQVFDRLFAPPPAD